MTNAVGGHLMMLCQEQWLTGCGTRQSVRLPCCHHPEGAMTTEATGTS
jgi:hypothetical protein